jgi:hypothetical protein
VDLSQCGPGEVAADGSSVVFAIGSTLTRHGVLDVAILPSPSAATPFSVRFDIPSAGSLAGRHDTGPAAAGPGSPSPSPSPSVSPSPLTSESALGQLGGAAPVGPSATVPGGPAVSGTVLPTSPARADSPSRRGLAAVLLVCLLGTTSLWMSKLRRGTAGDPRGVGRFIGVRTMPPSPL